MILIPGIAHIPGLADSVANLLLLLFFYMVHRYRSSFQERKNENKHEAVLGSVTTADARFIESCKLVDQPGCDFLKYDALITALRGFVVRYAAQDRQSFGTINDPAVQAEMQRLFKSLEGFKGLFAQAPQHAAELEGYLSCFAGACDERGIMDPSVLAEALKVLLKETHAVSVGSGDLEPPSPVSL